MKKGYTLSEVLVVLLVLGIIAAFIIPAVMRTAPERSSLLYKKTFYSLQEATSRLINDPNIYPEQAEIKDASGSTIQENLDGLFSDRNAVYFCEELAKTLNIIGEATCSSAGSQGAPNFITTNGVAWWKIGGDNFGNNANSFKDINIRCSGTDYRIRIYADGRVGTDANWTAENNILKQPFKFRDLSD